MADLNEIYAGFAVMAKSADVVDERASEMLPEVNGHWLFTTLWRYHCSVAIAAVLSTYWHSPASSSP